MSRHNNWKNRAREARLSRIARIMSGELESIGASVKGVRLNNQGKASTDGKVVYVPVSYDTGNPALELMMQEAVLAHEAAGHMRYTNFQDWHKLSKTVKSGDDDQLIHDFVNILEDARVNHLLSQDFPGSGKRLQVSQDVFMARHRKKWAESDSSDEALDPKAAIVAMMTEAITHTPHFNTDREAVCNFMDEVRPLLENAVRQPDTLSVIKQARRLVVSFRKYWPAFDEYGEPQGDGGEGVMLDDMSPEEIEKMAEAQEGQGVKVETVSKARFKDMKKTKPQDAPEGDASGKGDDGESDGDEGDSGDDKDDNGQATLDKAAGAHEAKEQQFDIEYDQDQDGDADALFAELTEALESEELQAGDMEHDFKEECADVHEDIDDGKIKRHEVKVSHGTEELVSRGIEYVEEWTRNFDATIQQNSTQIKTMQNELRRLISGKNSRFTDGLKRGNLDERKLWQHRTNTRLFKKKDQPKKAEANIIILVDASGSMGCGTRASSASEAASVFAEVMDGLGFGCEVVDFNSDGATASGYTNMRVRKAMNAPLNRVTKAAIRAPYVGSQNSDGYAVKWCLDRLKTFKGNRILFVISDGQPAGPYDNAYRNGGHHLTEVVRNAPSDIGVFSIGIDGMDTSSFYPNGAACSSADLTVKTMPIIRRMLRKVRAA